MDILSQQPLVFYSVVFIVGLLVGSFLNVVIFRLPVMMKTGWRRECLEFLQQSPEDIPESLHPIMERKDTADEPFNLLLPSSHCPHCNATVKPHHNIPVISYLFLKGKCADCKAPISVRYPLVELFTALASTLVAWHFGYSPQAFFALLLTWSLITLSFIDFDHQLLPDSINLPLLWLGLLLSLFDIYTDSRSSIIGAIAGYGSLWLVYHLFRLATGKEGMGYGDFKLLALFGAWLGWQYVPLIILLSSLVGALIGIAMVLFVKHDHAVPIPFGPYIAGAGWLALLWGSDINNLYLTNAGF
ncbi:MAG: prepilin peptidase [Gammaproteobacteria bacterium]